jgi:hypothetical protein
MPDEEALDPRYRKRQASWLGMLVGQEATLSVAALLLPAATQRREEQMRG